MSAFYRETDTIPESHSGLAAPWRFKNIPFDELVEKFTPHSGLISMALKTIDNLQSHRNIMVSISGGSDSDILIDLIETLELPAKITYVFFNTGLEYQATKDHIEWLRQHYGVGIHERRALVPIPVSCKKYGLPFLSKQVSEYIYRLQKHNFTWEDAPLDELLEKYPKCKAAIRWWCNDWGENSHFNINRSPYLKEFMVLNPPPFYISAKCCDGAKKRVARAVEAELQPDLCMTGVRKAEGGARATAYKTCFSPSKEGVGDPDRFRPLYYLKDQEKALYEQYRGVVHSDCYTKYGLDRTGCACCPFGKYYERELAAAQEHEPKLYRAAMQIFGPSYAYTKAYRDFAKERKLQEANTRAKNNGH